MLFVAGDHGYDNQRQVTLDGAAQAGLTLLRNEKLFCGLRPGTGKLHAWRIGQEDAGPQASIAVRCLYLRVIDEEQVVTSL